MVEGFTVLEISRQAYVPYTMLQRGPVILQLGRITITLTLSSANCCLVSVPPSFYFTDSESPNTSMISTHVNLGTSFLVSYRGEECEVRLGRRITVRDPN
jgi:hypothetical protein